MDKINFAIALHFHQPTGNFQYIFKRAYKNCYRPFFELLSKYPQIKIMLHISGCLLDYLDKNHKDAMKLIKLMVSRNQIEIMGGAYYEPILTAIPENDIIGQIKMTTDYIKQKFHFVPKGMWVAERVWDPAIAGAIYKAGMRYLILDDEHLLRSGVKKENMHGYFLTGTANEKIAVFPSDKKLRYAIPFKHQQETMDYLKGISGLGNKQDVLCTYGDDGEKFGEWPGTYEWVVEKQWLRNFFEILIENRDWIKLIHFSDYLKNNKPTADLTIEQGSYEEMMEWSGGNWLNFLTKYPEANQMHKKMSYVSAKIEKLDKQIRQKEPKKAKRQLYLGQCNCAYWHGVFGGLYLYHLRAAVYRHLIEAEKTADKIINKNKRDWLNIKEFDFDLDGKNEVIIENRDFSVYADLDKGGIITELDYRPFSVNLVNTLSRKKESYHKKILEAAQKQAGDSKIATIHEDFRKIDPAFKAMLFYDKFQRGFFRGYFIKCDLKLDDFIGSFFEELGDFSTGDYTLEEKNRGIILQRRSMLENRRVSLLKEIEIKSKNEIGLFVSIKKEGPAGLDALFGLEFNLTMPDLNSNRYRYFVDKAAQKDLNAQGIVFPEGSFGILDYLEELGISFNFSKKPKAVFYFPVKTISQSERAYELNYQCSCIFPMWELDFKQDNESSFKIDLIFKNGQTKK